MKLSNQITIPYMTPSTRRYSVQIRNWHHFRLYLRHTSSILIFRACELSYYPVVLLGTGTMRKTMISSLFECFEPVAPDWIVVMRWDILYYIKEQSLLCETITILHSISEPFWFKWFPFNLFLREKNYYHYNSLLLSLSIITFLLKKETP